MQTKLTIKLEETLIKSVKQYAKNHNRSISKLVEDYFRNLVTENVPKSTYTPLVEELSGVILEKDICRLDYVNYLEEKYE